tara:strand:+ start:453 stop:710 length:258 start_codon:yes stop_codon:yes gene_type:complete
MIAFNKGQLPEDDLPFSMKQLKSVIQSLISDDPYKEGSVHGGLSPVRLSQIISHLIYTRGHTEIDATIKKESDGYHLSLQINSRK